MSITVQRLVRLIVVVTEEFKAQRIGEMRTALAKLDIVGKQLASRIDAEPQSMLTDRLRAEQQRNIEARAELKRRIDGVANLELGSEECVKILAGPVEVEVGDDFRNLGACEIVVKDGKIIKIRDGETARVAP